MDDSTKVCWKGNSARCQLCQEPCPNSCGHCQKVFYCSKEHQIQDRRRHRPECFPGIVSTNPVVGRHLVASRPITAGEVILKEAPIISGPNGKSGLHPICLVCYCRVQGLDDEDRCSNCHWPIHRACKKDPVHGRNECGIFTKNAMTPFSPREIHMYEKVLILRCLLQKRTNRTSWDQIVDLQSHHAERHKTHKGRLLSRAAIEFIRRACGLPCEEFSDEEIDSVLGVLSTNAFVSEDNLTSSPWFRSGSYLYYYASLPAHDCSPNGKWSINLQSKYTLRAVRDIQKGESITQLYGDSTVGTLERRQHLKESKYFGCACPRCADPSENGSYYSGIKCSNCSRGYLLPEDALNEQSDWKCGSSTTGCDTTVSAQVIESFLGKIKKKTRAGDENSVEAVHQLETLWEKYGAQLHPNHYLLHEIEQGILQRCSYLLATTASSTVERNSNGTRSKGMKKNQRLDMAKKLIQLSRKSLTLLELISPGHTTHQGRQIFFLQQGLGILISARIWKSKCESSELQREITEFLKLRKLGASILETESEVREEFILAKKMSDDSDEILTRIRSRAYQN